MAAARLQLVELGQSQAMYDVYSSAKLCDGSIDATARETHGNILRPQPCRTLQHCSLLLNAGLCAQ